MSVTFVHTADWQIGKPFQRVVDPEKRARLRQQRVAAIGRVGEVAREAGAAFVLVAGDLFDSTLATHVEVVETLREIGRIGLPVLAIPGNHDSGEFGSTWTQEYFRRERAALARNFEILLEAKPVTVAGAAIFPCPLLRRREARDPTLWLRDPSALTDTDSALPRIVLAHGAVQGFTSDEEDEGQPANRIDLGALPDAFDYVALGDWHGAKQASANAWYAGTPEPDRFPKGPDHAQGHVLVVTVGRGAPPQVRLAPTARAVWREERFAFAEDGDLERLARRLGEHLPHAEYLVLSLALEGSLGFTARGALDSMLESWRARLLDLRVADRTRLAPSAAEIDELRGRTADPLIARVASTLADEAGRDGVGARVAAIALRRLHGLVHELGERNAPAREPGGMHAPARDQGGPHAPARH